MEKYLRHAFTYSIPIIMVVYYLIMRGINLNSFIVLPIFFFLTLKAIHIAVHNQNNPFVKMMNAFLSYCLLSGLFYAINNVPISCYFDTFRTFIFPFVFAYLGYNYSFDYEFNKWYLYGCTFCFVVGIYLYLVGPGYYTAWLSSVRDSGALYDPVINETNILEFTRFSSFFTTSYAISCFSIPTLIISLAFSMKRDSGVPKIWCYVIAFISFISAMLCQQRIAISFALIYVIFYGLFLGKLSNKNSNIGTIIAYVFISVFTISILGSISHYDWFERVSELVTRRFELMDFADAMNHRTGQYTSFDRVTDWSQIVGLGMGACGHAAIHVGLKGVADGEFVKSFYEYGIVGCSMLALLLISTLIRGVRYFKAFHVEVLIMVFYLAAGIGSNSLTFYLYSIMFWYSLGRIWNIGYLNRLRKEGQVKIL